MIEERIELTQQIVTNITQGDFAVVERRLAPDLAPLLAAGQLQAATYLVPRPRR